MSATANLPTIIINDESMREGLQIESADIPTPDKIELLDALSETGLQNIVVGSFVSPKWVPQMADVDSIIRGFKPREGVSYTALAMNARGVERYLSFVPPLSVSPSRFRTMVHLCDVFVRRNNNRSQQSEIDGWPSVAERARDEGVTEAAVGINAAWGSNWLGPFTQQLREDMIQRQIDLWTEAGLPVTDIWIGDPMGWNVPSHVEAQVLSIRERWPSITKFHLHLHNTRGMAVTSAYLAMRALDASCRLTIDTSLGGMAGCPYCGNGRAATLPPTEDFVQLLEAEGVDTGIDLDKVVAAVALAERVLGHPLYGHVSKAGPLPGRDALYAMDMPLVETLEQAQHFQRGPEVYEGAQRPWRAPIESPARTALGVDR
ncbi:MAG: citramalate synthase [Pseudonocardia sp. SCN 72-86]|nr:MAG: citramalate synthase [Pseudonocardia sp. SCN 72-86]